MTAQAGQAHDAL